MKKLFIKDKEDIYLQFLGGTSEVGATSLFINWKGTRILIDAGKRRDSHEYPEFQEFNKNIDMFILTHLHGDHIGSLMEYFSYFNVKNYYTSRENKNTLLPILKDCQKIIGKSKRPEDIKIAETAYSDEKIDELIGRMEVLDYKAPLRVNENLKITFLPTSHLLGSLGILLESHDYCLLVTSDYTESKKFFHPENSFLKALKGKKIDTIVTETTYGQNEEGDKIMAENCLNDLEYAINENFYTENPGNILIPCFALGRMQEIILALLLLKETYRIPFDTKIFLSYSLGKNKDKNISLGGKITERYYANYRNILEEELGRTLPEKFDDFVRENLNIYSSFNLENSFKKEKRSIFLVQPGMLGSEFQDEITGASSLALGIMEGDRGGIIFAGYQAQGTIGHIIQNLPYLAKKEIGGKEYQKNNRNIYKVTFPGHVSARGICSIVENLKPENVLLAHGEIPSSKNIAKALEDKNINVIIPEIEEKIYLMDNSKKIFFTLHDKISDVVIDYENRYKLFYDKNKIVTSILSSEEYKDYEIVNFIRERIKNIKEFSLAHFEFIISEDESTEKFFKQLQMELKEKNVTSNFVSIEKAGKKELLEYISELAAETNEKLELSIISAPLDKVHFFILIGEILFSKISIYRNNNRVFLPNLPFNLSGYIDEELNEDEGLIANIETEFSQLLKKLKKFRGKNLKKKNRDELPNQRPEYNSDKNYLYNSNIFYNTDTSLWGDVENVYEIKSRAVVKDLESIVENYNEKIKSITFTNFRFSYKKCKESREIMGYSGKNIYGKYILENGIQYFKIEFINEKIGDIMSQLKGYKEL